MGMFDSIKHDMEGSGVRLLLDAPLEVSAQQPTFNAVLTMEAKSEPKTVTGLVIIVCADEEVQDESFNPQMDQYQQGTQTDQLGRITLRQSGPWNLQPGAAQAVQFAIPVPGSGGQLQMGGGQQQPTQGNPGIQQPQGGWDPSQQQGWDPSQQQQQQQGWDPSQQQGWDPSQQQQQQQGWDPSQQQQQQQGWDPSQQQPPQQGSWDTPQQQGGPGGYAPQQMPQQMPFNPLGGIMGGGMGMGMNMGMGGMGFPAQEYYFVHVHGMVDGSHFHARVSHRIHVGGGGMGGFPSAF